MEVTGVFFVVVVVVVVEGCIIQFVFSGTVVDVDVV